MPASIERLCDVEDVRRWLEQFRFNDRRTATFLLESLVLVENAEFTNVLQGLVQEYIRKCGHTCGLFAAREVPGGVYFPDDATMRPDAVDRGAGVGSEGPLANVIRDIARAMGPCALDHPSIASMRASKCREIVIVDDIVATGHRVSKFCKALYRHPTIRSWLSLHYITFTAIVFAKTELGERYVRKDSRVLNILADRVLVGGRRQWSDVEYRAVKSLCHRYAPETTRPSMPLGMGDAFTCLVFQHKCPNTCPAILWAGGKKWRAIFRDRPSFDFPVWPTQLTAEERQRRILESVGQYRLSEGDWQKYIAGKAQLRLLTLAAAAKRIRRAEVLCDVLGVGLNLAERALAECVKSGWLTWDHRLTAMGQHELDHARELGFVRDQCPPLKSDVYFPMRFLGC